MTGLLPDRTQRLVLTNSWVLVQMAQTNPITLNYEPPFDDRLLGKTTTGMIHTVDSTKL